MLMARQDMPAKLFFVIVLNMKIYMVILSPIIGLTFQIGCEMSEIKCWNGNACYPYLECYHCRVKMTIEKIIMESKLK